MIQSDDSHLGCVCPECGNRCVACLGTNTVMSREMILSIRNNPTIESALLGRFVEDDDEQ